jgi:signal transduction histidine kinase
MNLFQALEAGADDFLSKPLNVSELEARIGVAERVIALHREREALSRVEGVLLAARTLEHELNNKLAAAQGFAELLSISPELHPTLRPLVEEIDQAASDAARILERLRSVVRVEELDWGQDLPTTLDIDRSTASAA